MYAPTLPAYPDSHEKWMHEQFLAAGVAVWRSVIAGKYAAGAIFLLNLLVLVAIVAVYRSGGAVAVDSLRAMTLRTGDRAVTAEDFERLTWQASPGIARARTLPPARPGSPVRVVVLAIRFTMT